MLSFSATVFAVKINSSSLSRVPIRSSSSFQDSIPGYIFFSVFPRRAASGLIHTAGCQRQRGIPRLPAISNRLGPPGRFPSNSSSPTPMMAISTTPSKNPCSIKSSIARSLTPWAWKDNDIVAFFPQCFSNICSTFFRSPVFRHGDHRFFSAFKQRCKWNHPPDRPFHKSAPAALDKTFFTRLFMPAISTMVFIIMMSPVPNQLPA